ncbi:Imm26 family immunity protein [Luteimonas changyuni]|uniref:Imm26 family immunity protein n=1 Tax=Luteimonas sp. MJ145 TaxID=3129234 RepID=UPI0031BADF1A
MTTRFPFKPKSTAHLRPGDFWAIPISGDRYGCGRVIALRQPGQTGARSLLIVGLMNWIGKTPPRADDLRGLKTVEQAQIHLRSVLETGGVILGNRPLEADKIEPDYFLSESPGKNCLLMKGYEFLRNATPEEQVTLQGFPTWGYVIIQHRAQALADSAA